MLNSLLIILFDSSPYIELGLKQRC